MTTKPKVRRSLGEGGTTKPIRRGGPTEPRITLGLLADSVLRLAPKLVVDLNDLGLSVEPAIIWDGVGIAPGFGIHGWTWGPGEHTTCGLKLEEAARLRDFICEHLGLPEGASWDAEREKTNDPQGDTA